METLQAQLNKLDGLYAHLARLESSCNRHATTQALQWALAHVELAQFEYTDAGYPKQSGDFVRQVLLAFMRQTGCRIPSSYAVGGGYDREPTLDERQAFHRALELQLHGLTGAKPCIMQEGRGDDDQAVEEWVVYSS